MRKEVCEHSMVQCQTWELEGTTQKASRGWETQKALQGSAPQHWEGESLQSQVRVQHHTSRTAHGACMRLSCLQVCPPSGFTKCCVFGECLPLPSYWCFLGKALATQSV
jgi:hypothetical protein